MPIPKEILAVERSKNIVSLLTAKTNIYMLSARGLAVEMITTGTFQ